MSTRFATSLRHVLERRYVTIHGAAIGVLLGIMSLCAWRAALGFLALCYVIIFLEYRVARAAILRQFPTATYLDELTRFVNTHQHTDHA